MSIRRLGLTHALTLLITIAASTIVGGAASAAPWNFVGARQQAMGGAGVANTSDSTSTYWNPANLAFQKGWGVNLPVTLNGAIENHALEQLSNMLVAYDELDATAKYTFQCAPNCGGIAFGPDQVSRIAALLAAFARYGTTGQNVHVGAALGLAGRYENFGFSATSLTTGSVFPNTDLGNLGLGAVVQDILSPGAGCCQAPANVALGNQVAALTNGQTYQLTNQQGGHLVYLLEQAGADTSDARVQQLALGLVDPASGALAANETGALAAGLSVQEFAFSYAHKLPVPFMRKTRGATRRFLDSWIHEKFALSVTPKYLLGVSFIKFFPYDTTTSAGGIVTSLVDIDSASVSHAFGLDIGLAYRPTNWLQIGMMARDVNSPMFEIEPFKGLMGAPVWSITLDPQVRIGVALIPIENLTLAFDFDATNNRIATLPRFRSRLVSLGGEYVIPLGQHVALALRVGGYSNVSDTVLDDWAMTGGIGLRIGSFHFDVSAGSSFAQEQVRTGTTTFDDFPTRLNVGVGFSWEKSL